MKLSIPKKECALLVIDMQNGFVHPHSAMGKSKAGTKEQQKIVPSIKNTIRYCRKENIPVIWTQQEHYVEDKTRASKLILPHSTKQGFLPCLRGSWEVDFYGDLASELLPSDPVVHKHRASAFFNTNLETKLRMLGINFLFISGCNTEFCVESTVRDAYARDFQLLILKDCLAGIEKKYHEASLSVFQAYFGEVLPSSDLENILV